MGPAHVKFLIFDLRIEAVVHLEIKLKEKL